MELDPVKAIRDSRPPATDYMTYLTILESHLSAKVLPELEIILQDEELTQNIGWDLVHLLLPIRGSEKCLSAIVRLGNPREVVLKVTEALQLLAVEQSGDEDDENGAEQTAGDEPTEPTNTEKFCTLVELLSVLLPRIKTKYPSRFLSTSLMAILRAFRPSSQATLSVHQFVHTLSGKKRPSLPTRPSSNAIQVTSAIGDPSKASAPDPEAQDEEPQEAAIQKRLLQSFLTHILEDYVNGNPIEWSSRLLEAFDPKRVVPGNSLVEAFKEESTLQTRDTVVGQLVVGDIPIQSRLYINLYRASPVILSCQTMTLFSVPFIRWTLNRRPRRRLRLRLRLKKRRTIHPPQKTFHYPQADACLS